ncbi:MAG: hypothetical protein V7782_15405 [Psychromonas sp.]
MSTSLDVSAQLSLTNENGKNILVSAEKQIITVILPTLWVGNTALKQVTHGRNRSSMIADVHAALKHADLMVEFRIANRVIALLGAQTHPSFLSRLVGFGAIELKIVAILLSLTKI